ncbi:MAG: CBS domain-containing protein, partial [Spirosomaceae bacterium]|nr:CBS domain-containing protein [Spirosomataceae bacterium]
DYARKGIVQGRKAKSTAMSEVMTPKVFTVEPDMTVRDCMQIMSDRHFRHLPVLDEGKVVGLLSVGDIVTNLITEQRQHINFLESYISS